MWGNSLLKEFTSVRAFLFPYREIFLIQGNKQQVTEVAPLRRIAGKHGSEPRNLNRNVDTKCKDFDQIAQAEMGIKLFSMPKTYFMLRTLKNN